MESKKGDTLVEVAFAIGIFSLVAITVVAVISASTSAAQAALETTLTREDIDGQAEALRFIHDSYVSGSQSAVTGDNAYESIWNFIKSLAYEPNDQVKTYNPSTCDSLYDNGWVKTVDASQSNKYPFIINIRKLYDVSSMNDSVLRNKFVKSAFSSGGTAGPFYEAETYPRILYDNMTSEDLYTQTQGGNEDISRVEGLFIVAVQGEEVSVTTGSSSDKKSAYYDFYIRSCWMPTNSDRPSTISTLVRLYDPAIVH
ncbi:hypothetical protein IJG93_00890 [Candidatus Saccharibacteria bacterium]|nr:hypothetical protein [Candidatus Saccharibacteria bacterium]